MGRRTRRAAAQPQLTERQIEVLVLLAQGESYSVIGTKMHLAPATVSYHVDRLKRATGQANVASLVSFAFVHGVLNPSVWPVEAA